MIDLRLVATPEQGTGMHKWIATGEDEDFKCSLCQAKDLKEGFLCENNKKLVLCIDCQKGTNKHKEFDMTLCKHDKEGCHRHIKWFKDESI